MTGIRETGWHSFPALALENDRLRVLFVPRLGGKIVSLFDKLRRHEWLVPPMRPVRQASYGADFVVQDMSGWDEMMPTIVACTVDGVSYPDHGEVWSLPWSVEPAQDGLRLSVSGVAWPYRFSRAATLVAADTLELRYALKNNALRPFPYLWAAHPQFAASESTRILLPGEVTRVVNVIAGDPSWGSSGDQYPWPRAQTPEGQVFPLDRIRSADFHACRKFYLPPDQHIGWAALVQEDLGCQIRLSWPPQDAPYLGLWVDEGKYNARPVAAPEPCTGYYDSLERAIQNNRVTVLNPGEEKRWKVTIQLNTV